MDGLGNVHRAWLGRVARVWWLSLLLVAVGASAAEAAPFVYVSVYPLNAVWVLDIATNTWVDTIPVTKPENLAITPDGTRVYVTNGDLGMAVIDTATNTVIDTVDVGPDPGGLDITPDGTRVYLSSGPVIDVATDSVIDIVLGIVNAGRIAITPNGEQAFITAVGQYSNCGWNPVLAVNTTTDTITQCLPQGPGKAPVDVAVSFDGTVAYVPVRGCPSCSDQINAINTATYAITLFTFTYAPSAIAIGPNGYVYVSKSHKSNQSYAPARLQVIDPVTKTTVADIPLDTYEPGKASSAGDLGFAPDGTQAYVVVWDFYFPPNPYSLHFRIDVIDTTTYKIVREIPVVTYTGNTWQGGVSLLVAPF